MCLIIFAWKVIPGAPLIAAANRDEYYARPTAAAAWWEDHPDVYAGRDKIGNGTWMGVTRQGRFAAITNVRSPEEQHSDTAPSRGKLVSDFLTGTLTPSQYIEDIKARNIPYNGFNLLVGDRDTLIWYSNRAKEDPRNGQPLEYGIYGLSNDALDTPWPKVTRAKAEFASMLIQGAPEETYFELLADTTRANDCRLPKTGISIELERILSSVFISSEHYGTRSSSVVYVPITGEPVLNEHTICHITRPACEPRTDHAPKKACCPKPQK
jgi:uncharacterized protein with NRDE domain